VSSQIGDVVRNKTNVVTEKNLGYIDFKTTNDIMIGRQFSKNLELSPSNMLQLYW